MTLSFKQSQMVHFTIFGVCSKKMEKQFQKRVAIFPAVEDSAFLKGVWQCGEKECESGNWIVSFLRLGNLNPAVNKNNIREWQSVYLKENFIAYMCEQQVGRATREEIVQPHCVNPYQSGIKGPIIVVKMFMAREKVMFENITLEEAQEALLSLG